MPLKLKGERQSCWRVEKNQAESKGSWSPGLGIGCLGAEHSYSEQRLIWCMAKGIEALSFGGQAVGNCRLQRWGMRAGMVRGPHRFLSGGDTSWDSCTALTLPIARWSEWASEVSQGPAVIILGRDSEGLCQESGHGWRREGKGGPCGRRTRPGPRFGELMSLLLEILIWKCVSMCQQDTHIS